MLKKMNRFERLAEENRKVTEYLVNLGQVGRDSKSHAALIKLIKRDLLIAFSEFRLGNVLRAIRESSGTPAKPAATVARRRRGVKLIAPSVAREVRAVPRTFAERLDGIEASLKQLLHHLGLE